MKDVVRKVSIITIAVNLLLTIIKIYAGIIDNSSAVLSDALHSASDVLSTFVVMIGVHLAGKESDKEHPYGHERLECIAAIILATILVVTGGSIGIKALVSIVTKNIVEVRGTSIAITATIISIITKELMFWYTKINAEKIKSGALLADAWHHRSDSLSSIGALIGLIAMRNGIWFADALTSIIISLIILKVSYDIFVDSVDKLVDKSCDKETEKEIYNFVKSYKDIESIDVLQTRLFGNKIYVDLEVGVSGEYTLREAHNIAEDLHNNIEKEFKDIKHIMVHINPVEA